MVTRILFDPRRDLPDGSTVSIPVTVTATPTIVRENGAVVIVPSSLTFTVNTAADVVELPPSTASDAWRLTVRDAVTLAIVQTRTVRVPDTYSIDWQAVPDVDPDSLTVNTGTARQWDATFRVLAALITNAAGGGGGSSGVQIVQSTPSATWSMAHGLGRRPGVELYLTSGERVITDVTADNISLVATFATPQTGYAVLT